MSNADQEYVSREEHEKFKQDVVDFLGILVQAFDKNTNAARSAQKSVDNLAEAIEGLVELESEDSDILRKNNSLLGALYNKLIGPPKE